MSVAEGACDKFHAVCYYNNYRTMKELICRYIQRLRPGLILFALLAGPGLSACSLSQTAVRADDYLPPYEGQITADVLGAHTFMNIVNSVRSEVKGAVSDSDGGRSGSFSGVFAFRSPSALRIRLFGPFGATVLDMVSAGGVFQVHNPGAHRLYEGPQLFDDAPSDIPPYIKHYDGLIYLVRYAPDIEGDPAPRDVFVFDERTLRNTGILLYRDGEPFIEMVFGEFTGRVPGRVRLAIARGPVIEMQMQSPELNAEIPDRVFRPVSHEGNEVLPLSAIDPGTFGR